MPTVQLLDSAVAVCPRENVAAVLPAPGHGGLWGTPGRAGEGDIFPDVGHDIDRRFGEQWASCGKSRVE